MTVTCGDDSGAKRLMLVQGLWRGTIPGLLLTVPYTAVQFVTYDLCRKSTRKAGEELEDFCTHRNLSTLHT